jgi:hypothetical protein
LVDHFDDLRYYFVAGIVELFEGLAVDVIMVKGDLEMNLSLAGLRPASLSFDINAALYRRFRQASARFAQIERHERLI